MRCNSGDMLTEEQLSIVIDGQADEKLLDHLASCQQCAARLAIARSTELALRSRLHRFDCPSAQELSEYHMGMVNSSTDKRITRHLALCVACREEIETLRGFLLADHPHAHIATALQPKPSLVSSLNEIIANVLPRNPQLALRGNSPSPLSAKAGKTTLLFVQERDQQQRPILAGQILDDDLEQWIGAKVEIYHDATLLQSSVIDELGGFAMQADSEKAISLRIVPHAGQTIVVPDIDL